MRLTLSTSSASDGIYLYLPVTPAEVSEAFAHFERIGVEPSMVRIVEASERLPYIALFALSTDIHNTEEFQKLNNLAMAMDQMSIDEYDIFASALKTENICSLDDVIRISEHLDDYIILPHIKNDADLCKHLLDIGFKECPEDMRAYLDFEAVGREFRREYGGTYGGAYGNGGYVRRKTDSEQVEIQRNAVITLYLTVAQAECRLLLPAEEANLKLTKKQLGICDFAEARIVKVECNIPYIGEMVCGLACPSVESYNLLSEELQEFQKQDGALLTYAAVLEVEQPETVEKAWELAWNLDDYERITEDASEYGKSVLERIGADEEIINTIDGYMDFERFGADAMVEDGVIQTEFGLIRRCSTPFPAEEQIQQMRGL